MSGRDSLRSRSESIDEYPANDEFVLESILVLTGLKSAYISTSDVSYFTSLPRKQSFDVKKKRPFAELRGDLSELATSKRRQYKPTEGIDKAAAFYKGCRVQLRANGKEGTVIMEKAGGWREILFADGKTSRYRPSELRRIDDNGSESPAASTSSESGYDSPI
jgi:hypothetical protein